MANKTDTKRALIDATKELIREGENFTVKDISARAFTNIAAINYHFGDKNKLVHVALSEMMDGFREVVFANFTKDFSGDEEALEEVLKFLLDVYSQYKGAIRFMLLTQDPVAEQMLIERFFFGDDFMKAFVDRLSEKSKEEDPDVLFYKLSITISAFLLPLLVEGQSSTTEDKISLTALQEEKNKKAFVKALMLLFR